MLKIIDTSHWKKDVPVNALAIDGLYTKATEGNYYIDDACDLIVQQAVAGGKKWGVYHFATNQLTDPTTEANYFVDNCMGYIGKGLLILDNESYKSSTTGQVYNVPTDVAWAKAWLDQVYSRTGVKALIYMSLSVIQEADWSSVVNGGYGLICADYVDSSTPIVNFSMDPNRDPNPRWDGTVNDVMWQFTSTGRLDGYGGNLDCNYFYGDTAAWDAYAQVNGQTPTPPTPTPPPSPVITTQTDTETKPIPFKKVTVDDPIMDKGTSKVTQIGVDGVETITYTVTLTDGVETGRVMASDEVTTQDVSEITSVGTKPIDNPKPAPVPINWKQLIATVVAAVAAIIAALSSWLHH